MAYIANQDKNKKNIEQTNKENQQMIMSGGSSDAGMSQIGSPPAAQQSAPRFQNIQNVLQANKGAGQELASRVSGGIGREIGGQTKAVGKTEGDVSATAAAIQSGRDVVKTSLGDINKQLGEGKQVAPTVTESKTLTAPTPTTPIYTGEVDYNKLGGDTNTNNLGFLSGYTTGKTQDQQQTDLQKYLNKFTDVSGAAQKQVGERMSQLGTAQGRTGLLEDMIARGQQQYTKGMGALDQAFIQRQGGQTFKDQQRALQAQQKALGERIKSGSDLGLTAGEILKESKALSGDVRKGLGSIQGNLQEELEKRRQDVVDKNVNDNEILNKFAANDFESLTAPQKARLQELIKGKFALGEHTYGLTQDQLRQYIQNANTEINKADVINKEELNKYKVLQALRGASENEYTDVGNIDKTQAGFNQELRAELDRRKDLFENAIKNAYFGGANVYWHPKYGAVSLAGPRDITTGQNVENIDYGRRTPIQSSEIIKGLEGAVQGVNQSGGIPAAAYNPLITIGGAMEGTISGLTGNSPEQRALATIGGLTAADYLGGKTNLESLIGTNQDNTEFLRTSQAVYGDQLRRQLEDYLTKQGYYTTLGNIPTASDKTFGGIK